MSVTTRTEYAVSRRRLLWAGGLAAVTAPVASCDLLETDPDGSGERTDTRSKGREAPSLADQVKAGDLPPLEQRLPAEPLVVEPINEIGAYSGTMNMPLWNAGAGWLYRQIGYESLVNWNPEFTDVIPNIALSFEVLGDGTEYVFDLREGLRWSDGEPFTADDVLFAYEDVFFNDELNEAGYGAPSFLSRGGEPLASLEKEGDYRIRFRFTEPNGMFLQTLATPPGGVLNVYPKHYLQQFHPTYNPDVEELVEEEGVASWIELFDSRAGLAGVGDDKRWQNLDLPVLYPWRMTSVPGKTDHATAERNPYYWKVDTDGSQLPYFDRIDFQTINDQEVLVLAATNGEIDLEIAYINALQNKPVLAQHRESGNYDFLDLIPSQMNHVIVTFNLTSKNERLREIMRNKDLRIGLSYAIDREEMISALYQRQGEPWQTCPHPESGFHLEELAKQYTEYDPDQANEYLDRAGYNNRDGDGFRLGPDGERIRLPVDSVAEDDRWAAALELVKTYWEEVGIELQINNIGSSLFYERFPANDHDALVWGGDPGIQDSLLSPRWYMPTGGDCLFAVDWGLWYASGGQDGEEPPDGPREQMRLYDQIKATPDQDEQRELFLQILRIAQEEFYCIGTVKPDDAFGVVRNDLGNVLEPMPSSYLYPTPGPSRLEQYYRIR